MPAPRTIRLFLLPALAASSGMFLAGLVLAVLGVIGIRPFGPSAPNLDAFARLAAEPGLGASVVFTLWIALASTLLSLIGGVALALLLRRARPLTRAVASLNIAVPHLVIAVAVALTFAQSGLFARIAFAFGLIDGPSGFPALTQDRAGLGILIAYLLKEIPFVAVVALSEMAVVGSGPETVARSLGASKWQAFRHALWPLIRPPVLAVSAIIFAFALASYDIPSLLGPSHPATLPVLSYNLFASGNIADRPAAIALALVTAIPAILALVVSLRYDRGARPA